MVGWFQRIGSPASAVSDDNPTNHLGKPEGFDHLLVECTGSRFFCSQQTLVINHKKNNLWIKRCGFHSNFTDFTLQSKHPDIELKLKKRWYVYTDVSEISGTPKSSILVGFSIINHPFWGTPIFGNTHVLFRLYQTCVSVSGANSSEVSFFQGKMPWGKLDTLRGWDVQRGVPWSKLGCSWRYYFRIQSNRYMTMKSLIKSPWNWNHH